MNKSQQIMALYDGKRTTREIAEIVGCKPEYVRVVARQRKGRGLSESDRRYRSTEKGKASLERSIIKFQSQLKASRQAYNEVVRSTGNRAQARSAARSAYDAARLQGKDVQEAKAHYSRVYMRTLVRTADQKTAIAASRRAYRESASVPEAAE